MLKCRVSLIICLKVSDSELGLTGLDLVLLAFVGEFLGVAGVEFGDVEFVDQDPSSEVNWFDVEVGDCDEFVRVDDEEVLWSSSSSSLGFSSSPSCSSV